MPLIHQDLEGGDKKTANESRQLERRQLLLDKTIDN